MSMKPFAFSKTGHYLRNAYHLALASQLAYEDVPGTVRNQLKPPFEHVYHLSKEGAQGFVAAGDKHIVVAFRGSETDEARDWIDNLRYRQVEGYGGKVHQGFAEQLQRIWPPLLRSVRRYQNNNQAI